MLVEVMPRESVGSKLMPLSFESLNKTSAAEFGVNSRDSFASGDEYVQRSSRVLL